MNIVQIQEDLRGLPQYVPYVEHRFCGGIYSRSMHINKGCLIEGGLHKTHHPYVLSAGVILVKNGDENIILKAPYHGETKPGDKRFIFAYEDAVFTTFHATNLTDIKEIEKFVLGEEI